MTDEELSKETALEYLRTINRALRKPAAGESRVLGTIQNIDCKNGIVFTIRTDAETLLLKSKNFTGLALNAFRPVTTISAVGCDAELATIKALVTYSEHPAGDGRSRGDIVSVEFVPDNFRLLSDAEMNSSIAFDPESRVMSDRDSAGILREMNRELFRAGPGEKRDIGYLDQIECTSKGSYLHIRTNTQTLKLFTASISGLQIRLFTRELGGMEFGCAMKPINLPIVFVFKETRDSKDLADGEIFTLEFVPRNFILDLYPVGQAVSHSIS